MGKYFHVRMTHHLAEVKVIMMRVLLSWIKSKIGTFGYIGVILRV